MLITFFDTKGIVHRRATQSVAHTAVMFYGDCLKMCEDFLPNFGDKITGCCIATTCRLALPFSLFSVPPLKMKLEGRHFGTIEVIEAESQAVLNTLTEHDLQGAFKQRQKRWERCKRAEGDYFEGDNGQ
jgi:hypothetical protein